MKKEHEMQDIFHCCPLFTESSSLMYLNGGLHCYDVTLLTKLTQLSPSFKLVQDSRLTQLLWWAESNSVETHLDFTNDGLKIFWRYAVYMLNIYLPGYLKITAIKK